MNKGYAGDHTHYSPRPSLKDGGELAGGQRVSTPQPGRLTVRTEQAHKVEPDGSHTSRVYQAYEGPSYDGDGMETYRVYECRRSCNYNFWAFAVHIS